MVIVCAVIALLLAPGVAAAEGPPRPANADGTVPTPFDPTANVVALTAASNKRQDDLRDAQDKLIQSKFDDLTLLNTQRSMSLRDLAQAEARRIDEQATLRAAHAKELSDAEAKRIDAIRAVDVNAVAVANERGATAANVLAANVQQSAEALRALVASTATTNATQQQQANTALSARITTLEQANYEGKGKSTIADPAFQELLLEVKALSARRSETSGSSTATAELISYFIAGFGLLIAFIVGLTAYLGRRGGTTVERAHT
jgi:hypothetical protein